MFGVQTCNCTTNKDFIDDVFFWILINFLEQFFQKDCQTARLPFQTSAMEHFPEIANGF